MNQSDHILELARLRRVLRAADVREHGWSPQLLIRLHQAGKLQRFARGLYGLPDAEVTEHQTLIEVCQRVPKAVLCLLSALQFHEIGTQQPHEVWIALPEATQTPALSHPTLRMTRLRGTAYSEGIETVTGHGAPIRVYSAAKTVADCFKFRNKIGLDVALEALKDAWRSRKVTMAELSHFAKVNRVERVMQPYLEAVTQCPSDLGILALRLHPGDDLRGALEAGCRTAFVVAGLGSFSQAQLRFAGDSAPTLMHGPLELLSLTGSLTPVGAHLHASVSDAAGRVWGGHVCVGCIVRTTVELLVAPLPEGSLTRAFDAATGYTELVVRRP